MPLRQPLGADGNAVQRIAHDIKIVEIVAPRFRDDKALAFAIEKFDGKLGFERLDLVAHRPLRNTQSPSAARVKLSCRAARLQRLLGLRPN